MYSIYSNKQEVQKKTQKKKIKIKKKKFWKNQFQVFSRPSYPQDSNTAKFTKFIKDILAATSPFTITCVLGTFVKSVHSMDDQAAMQHQAADVILFTMFMSSARINVIRLNNPSEHVPADADTNRKFLLDRLVRRIQPCMPHADGVATYLKKKESKEKKKGMFSFGSAKARAEFARAQEDADEARGEKQAENAINLS